VEEVFVLLKFQLSVVSSPLTALVRAESYFCGGCGFGDASGFF
jgi:hypothetical protein